MQFNITRHSVLFTGYDFGCFAIFFLFSFLVFILLVSILVFCFATSASHLLLFASLGNNIYRDTYVNDTYMRCGGRGVAPTALWQHVYRLSKSATEKGLRKEGGKGLVELEREHKQQHHGRRGGGSGLAQG